ncbi:MAG TPA: tonB-system energizer ExbB [Hyphomicrobiaceae bacterium]
MTDWGFRRDLFGLAGNWLACCAAGLLLCTVMVASPQAQDGAVKGETPSLATTEPSAGQRTQAGDGASSPASDTVGQPAAPQKSTLLPQDLSPWGMFASADIVVQSVMVGLFIASIVTWTVALAKSLELMVATRRLRSSISRISGEKSLRGAIDQIQSRGLVGTMLDATASELRLSNDAFDVPGIKERVASRMQRLESAAGRSIIRGTGVLATIGSTAPFVGLFGTVWGIMNSFIGISKAQTTNLAVVAPGIAEALLATAIGLVAAIPAVIIYNQFSRWTAGYRALVGDASAHVQRLVSRDLDRATLTPRGMKAAAE